MQINKLILPGYLILIQSSHNNSLLREAFKIEKNKSVNIFTLFYRGWVGFEVIFTLFILCLEWPN